MEYKSFPITEMKAIAGGDQAGTFEAIVAVFGNVDDGGDRIERGAFKRTLSERGLPPIVWSHQWEVPPIGVVTEAVENNEGLRVKGRLFVGEGEDSPVARQVYTAMKAQDGNGKSPLREFSFGYSAKDYSIEAVDGEDIRVLKDLDLFEVGPTLVGMNPATRLLGVKQSGGEIHISLSGDTAALKKEPVDKPKPKPAEGEEAQARIRQLLAEQSRYPQETPA